MLRFWSGLLKWEFWKVTLAWLACPFQVGKGQGGPRTVDPASLKHALAKLFAAIGENQLRQERNHRYHADFGMSGKSSWKGTFARVQVWTYAPPKGIRDSLLGQGN